MSMNPTNTLNPETRMYENKNTSSADKFPHKPLPSGDLNGGHNGTGATTTAMRNPGSNPPIFIDIDTLELTIISGNQENYHENVYGDFGRTQDEYSADGDQKGCDACDFCDKDDWDDDDIDPPDIFDPDSDGTMPVSNDAAPCNTCEFSAECLKSSIASDDNIYIDQIIRELAFIANVPLSTAMMVFNAYLAMCSIFCEDTPVRFRKSKYDKRHIPVGLDDLTERIHKAVTRMAYGLPEEEPEQTVKHQVDSKHQMDSKQPDKNELVDKTVQTNRSRTEAGSCHESSVEDVIASLPDPVKAFLKDAPDELKKLLNKACDGGKELRIYRIDVGGDKKDGVKNSGNADDDRSMGNASHSGSGKDHKPNILKEVFSHE